jgi:alkylation response protein AidB-like acyl-CoA dehydrogenase
MITRLSPTAPPADEQHWIDTVSALAVGFAEKAAHYDEVGEIPVENLKALGDSGLDVACLPVSAGGEGLSFRTIGAVIAIVSAACPSTGALWLMHIGAAYGLVTLAEPSASAFFAGELKAGKRFANALSEPTSGNMFLMPQQAAEPVDGDYVLDGAKRFVSGCEIADYYLTNTLADGVPAFFGVARDDTIGFVPIWDTMGMRATRSQLMSFNGTVLRSSFRLARPAPEQANLISAGLPFVSIGIAESALDAFSTQARGRVIPSTGEPLSKMQWLKFDTASEYVQLRAARMLAEQTMWLADNQHPDATLVAVEAKLLANEVAKTVAALGVKVGGGSGYLRTSPIQRHFRDAQAGALMAYSVEVCQDTIGGWVLDPA